MTRRRWIADRWTATTASLTGDQAAEGFIERAAPPLTIVRQTRRERYRLDLLRRAP